MLSTNSIICFYFICHLIFQRHFFRWLNFPSFLQTCPCCILWQDGDTITESSDKLPGLLVEQIVVLVKNLSPNYIFMYTFQCLLVITIGVGVYLWLHCSTIYVLCLFGTYIWCHWDACIVKYVCREQFSVFFFLFHTPPSLGVRFHYHDDNGTVTRSLHIVGSEIICISDRLCCAS